MLYELTRPERGARINFKRPAVYLPPTYRQLQILALVADGLNGTEVGQRLGITRNTVKNTLTGLYRRIGARNQAHAVALMVGQGYLHIEQQPRIDILVNGKVQNGK